MKIIVIGGTGLIGKKVVKNLRDKGHEVAALATVRFIFRLLEGKQNAAPDLDCVLNLL